MNIIQRFIPTSKKETRPGIKMTPKYITIHETDNPGAGANANAHARLQERGNDRTASWHLQVDDHDAIQSIPFDEVAWAAGDGRNGPGNTQSIHIEICVNADGDYKKAVQNTAEVTRQLMAQYNITIDRVVQHNKWSGKNCPKHLRAGDWGVSWSDFINLVKGGGQPVNKASVVYEAHVEDVGWQGVRRDGQTAGTTGRYLRLEALTVRLENSDAKLEMQGHVENKGWTPVRTNGEIIGTMGEGLRLEAIAINCDKHTITYRVHIGGLGWTNWAKNGEGAGTTGKGLRIEAVEIKLD